MLARQHRHRQQLTKLPAAIIVASISSIIHITSFCSSKIEGEHGGPFHGGSKHQQQKLRPQSHPTLQHCASTMSI